MPTVETVTINSISFPLAGAWEFVDLTPLMVEGPGRGSDVSIPGVAGVEHRQQVLDAVTVSLPMLIRGEVDSGSSAHPDIRTGLKDNVVYLSTNLLDHNVGSVTATVTYPDTSTLSGTVAVRRLTVENLTRHATVLRAVMRVVLLDGKLS